MTEPNTPGPTPAMSFEALLRELAAIQAQKDAFREAVTALAVEKAVLERDIAHVGELRRRAEEEATVLEKRVADSEARVLELANRERTAAANLRDVESHLAERTAERLREEKQLADLVASRRSLEVDLSALQASRADLSAEVRLLEVRLGVLREEVSTEQGRLARTRGEHDDLLMARDATSQELAAISKQRTETTEAAFAHMESLRQEEVALVETLRTRRQELAGCEATIAELRAAHRPLKPWYPSSSLPRPLMEKVKLSCQVRYVDRLALRAVLGAPSRFPGYPTTLDEIVNHALRNYLPSGESVDAYADAMTIFAEEESRRQEKVNADPDSPSETGVSGSDRRE